MIYSIVVTALLSSWREGLTKTSQKAFGRLVSVLGASEITNATWAQREGVLIQADIGVSVSGRVVGALQEAARNQVLHRAADLREALRQQLRGRLAETPTVQLTTSPFVILMVGVNGSGKTTTVAKLVHHFQKQGKSVLLGPADTFRAAAVQQLGERAVRLDVEMISGAPESDRGAVTFDTIQAGIAWHEEVIRVDTAGWLQTRSNS